MPPSAGDRKGSRRRWSQRCVHDPDAIRAVGGRLFASFSSDWPRLERAAVCSTTALSSASISAMVGAALEIGRRVSVSCFVSRPRQWGVAATQGVFRDDPIFARTQQQTDGRLVGGMPQEIVHRALYMFNLPTNSGSNGTAFSSTTT